MNVFVETNFVLELALEQQESQSCEKLLELAGKHDIRLWIPAYSLIEPHETLTRRHRDRESLRSAISSELTQLARSATMAQRASTSQDVVKLLAESLETESKQLDDVKQKILATAELLPLDASVLAKGSDYQNKYDLSAQDAVVYASIRTKLEGDHAVESCFISRDSGDFDDPDLRQDLAALNCKYFASFVAAIQFIEHSIRKP